MPIITVLGSLNVDMVTMTKRVPEGGETFQAKSFDIGWGGKGANQAVAAARLSRSQHRESESDFIVRMVGAVGSDVFGPEILKSLEEDGVDVQYIRQLQHGKTGTAVILVEEASGENRILFTPGANFDLNVQDELVPGQGFGDVAVFQLETPLDVVCATIVKIGRNLTLQQVIRNIKLAHASGTKVILNPAPAQNLPDDLYPELTYLILNESEAAILTDRPRNSISAASNLDTIVADFIEKGVAHVILTLGAEGAFYQTVTRLHQKQPGARLPAVKAKVVDTTAAGDTFVGAFADSMDK